MDAVKRRDRYDKKPALNKRGLPKRAYMTPRQQIVLRALAEHSTLTIYDLHAILSGSLHALRRSVRRLKDEPNEYIRVLPEQQRNPSYRENLYYQLAPRGVEWLTANGHKAEQPRRVYNLGHTGLVSHIMASITAGVAAHPNTRLVSWDEMQTHPKFPAETGKMLDKTAIPHGNAFIRPDTHPFGIELLKDGRKAYRFFVIEADNGTETIYPRKPREYKGNSIYAKFEAYRDFIESKGFHTRYGLPNYFPLFVFTNPQRLANAMTLLGSMGASKFILFQLANRDAPPGYIFTSACERVGYPPFYLNQP